MLLQVAVLYASDYGFSDRLSQTIARGITKANVAVEMLDLLSADPQVIALQSQSSDMLLLLRYRFLAHILLSGHATSV